MKLLLTRAESAALCRRIFTLDVSHPGFALSLLLGITSFSIMIALDGAAAWLIVRASQQLLVSYLMIVTTPIHLFGVSRALACYLSRLTSHKLVLTGTGSLCNNLYDELTAASGTKLSMLHRGGLVTRTGADVDEISNITIRILLPGFAAATAGVGTVGVITIISLTAGIILAISLVVPSVIAPALTARSRHLVGNQGADVRINIAMTSLATLEGAIKLSMADTLERACHPLSESETTLGATLAHLVRLSAFARGLNVYAMGIAVIGALLIGIPQMTSGVLVQILLAVIVLVPLSIFEGTVELTPAAIQLVCNAQVAAYICSLLNEETLAQLHDIPEGVTVIEVRDLTTGRSGGPTLATGISLMLCPGSSLMIVGPSGISKMTLLVTLAGIIPPKPGSSLTNGVPA